MKILWHQLNSKKPFRVYPINIINIINIINYLKFLFVSRYSIFSS